MEKSCRSAAVGTFGVDGILGKLSPLVATRDAREVGTGNAEALDSLGPLEVRVLEDIHCQCAGATPNDLKLSDCPARRDGCAGEGGGAAGVTRGAVRSSAWLGVTWMRQAIASIC